MSTAASLEPLNFPLHGCRLIEASAGTGKTWTLASLYVRLVLNHGDENGAFGRALLPPEILVVTFTEASTSELRGRIRERLNEAMRCFRGQPAPDPFLADLVADYPEAKHSACARTLELAAQWMDEAAIFTIHGWCQRMLRHHAFDSGSLFNLELDAHDRDLLAEVVRDYWRKHFYPLEERHALAVQKLLGNPADLLKTMEPLMRYGEAVWQEAGAPLDAGIDPYAGLAEWSDWENRRAELETAARECWRQNRGEIETSLNRASAEGWLDGRSYPAKNFEGRLQALWEWAEHGIAPSDSKWLINFGQTRIKMKKDYLTRLPRHPAFEHLDTLADHLEKEPKLSKAAMLHHLVRWVRERYAAEKQNRARLDFDDLLTLMDEAFAREGRGGRLAQVIRRQYPVALIDEFQDTDPVQSRIFEAVYRADGDGRTLGLFLVGDPKQAIYSFRGADIHTYLRARTATAGNHYTLGKNFRSALSLVAAINRVFQFAENLPGGVFGFRSDGDDPLPFLPVEAKGRDEEWVVEGENHAPLTLWHLESRDGPSTISVVEYRRDLAATTATEIVRLLNLAAGGRAGFRNSVEFRPLQPADITILVRDRTEARAIRLALAEGGVRSVYLSDRESVYASGEAADLLAWLRACAEPESDRCLRAALATATLDWPFEKLDELSREEWRWEEEVERFRGYRQIWRNQGVLPMLRRLMGDFDLPARLLGLSDGERRLTNLLHLGELLQTASTGLDGERALLRYLAEALEEAAKNGNPPDANLVRLESDEALVKIVTIHKSKGLEYPLVFLPFACAFKEVDNRRNFHAFHDEDGKSVVELEAKPKEKEKGGEKGKDEKENGAIQKADRERLQEDLRLFYVALTRARHACWLGVAPIKKGNSPACVIDKSAFGYLLGCAPKSDPAVLGARLAALADGCPHIRVLPCPEPCQDRLIPHQALPKPADARTFHGLTGERWWIASYTSISVPAPAEAQARISESETESPDTPGDANLSEVFSEPPVPVAEPESGFHRFPPGPRSGVFLHGLLEQAARDGFGSFIEDPESRNRLIAARCRNRRLDEWVPVLDDWLQQLLTLPLELPGGSVRLADIQPESYQAEMEFWFAAEGVDAQKLDAAVSAATLAGTPRTPIVPNRLNGMLKGFIDLVFEHGGRYYVLDYKSNHLGDGAAAYTETAMRAAILEKRYDLQYVLYLLAMHRLLRSRLGDEYDYDRHIGGGVYLFLRGVDSETRGVWFEKPRRELMESLDRCFRGGI